MILRPLLAFLTCAPLAVASSVERNPLNRITAISGPRIHTTSQRVHALSHFDLSFDIFDGTQRLKLSLEPNHDVLHDEATVSYIDADGNVSNHEPIDRLAHKIYKGSAYQEQPDGTWSGPVGFARINLRRDGDAPLFEGAFSVQHNSHHIQMSSFYMSTKHTQDPAIALRDEDYMVVWRDSDISPLPDTTHEELRRSLEDDRTCSSDDLNFNSDLEHPVLAELMRRGEQKWGAMDMSRILGKRQIDSQTGNGNQAGVNLATTIGNNQGCPKTRKVALVGVATDCSYMGTFNSTESARQNIITVMNSASQVWESSFNISLGLRNLTVSNANCPGSVQQATPWNQNCDANLDISARLNLFSGWRGGMQDGNSHWTLLTNCRSGSAVGLAWLGQACVSQATTSSTSTGNETVSGANVVAKTSQEWQVIAHETGHTFGAVHDCTDQTCANSQVVSSSQCCPFSTSTCPANGNYIMNPSTSPNANTFSPCSIGNICSAVGRSSVNTQCLSDNRGVTTISGQQCGNGIVEQGEECDCGGVASCGNNPCCDPTTCRFKGNAVCDDSNEDCCRGCQFASSSTVCRASTGVCDPAETCTGTSPNCPADARAPDGQSCTLPSGTNTSTIDTSQLRCAAGQCTSRDLQCKTVMGAYTHGSNDTYACDSSSCSLSCASPQFGPGVCYGLQQNLLDGTPCGGGGHCSNGQCSGSTFGGEVTSWVNDHRNLVIGIACAVGGLILIAFLSCLWRCCCGRRRTRKLSPTASAVSVQPMMMSGAGGGPGGSVPPPGGYYGSRAMPRPPPPPAEFSQAATWDQPGWRPPPPPTMQVGSPRGAWAGPAPPVPPHGMSSRYA